MPTTRTASTPAAGGLRDALRTFVAFGVAALFAFIGSKLGDSAEGVDLVSMQEGLTVIIVSAVLAFLGKAFRNSNKAVGKIL